MVRISRRGWLALALIALLFLIVPDRLKSAVRIVRAGDSIASALSQASPGDTLRLDEGEYFENLVIEVPIVLTGKGHPWIRGGYEGIVIHIKAPGTVIDGLRVSEAGTRLIDDMACILVEADSVTIQNNRIDESLHGIYVKAGSWITIHDNRIEGRLDLIEEDRGNGIHLWNSRHSRIERNEILNTRDGIYFSFADSTIIRQNHVHHVRYGLHYMYSNHNIFEDNLFDENVAGAALMYSQNIGFYRNVFARCRGFRAYGILYQSMDDTRAEGNLILDNSRGIFLNNSGGNILLHNDVVDNDVAVQMNAGSDANIFAGNNFINNLSELLLDISHTEIVWTDSSGGNYWSGYDGYDLDGDGIGDKPYTIQNVFQVLESNCPEVRFYLFSPAAEILEAAERALPILELGKSRDAAPRMRPLANHDVPWFRVRQDRSEMNPLVAGAFFIGSATPLFLLLGLSRNHSGKRK
ncbi:MAG: nitrous oxide reductase family maturation protein NosD [Candidatus Latescibacteria bacterium]|nr:nitrous oxide reductase family maturation protein NosD [Candidatus Latescibacterota bacterium]NIM22703.1 nitrous oxide reductase family maturation protein NosD [Candidatus Latescibacterota bacterium]NIM64992.1 nitrous oxide reductase family maturation protein NosD [Candidatus Latescibacterota bacterium]NIO01507.1 nitrous oxide reductase family maturation protein NosD [Candidatus Latescibacterota bacterium]NIO28016.1 nitrous oxide reductase family maturation protein NosD [Candidatus Latesciba